MMHFPPDKFTFNLKKWGNILYIHTNSVSFQNSELDLQN